MSEPTVKMIEYQIGRWKIVATAAGHTIVEDIKLRDVFSARDYIKNWVTSFGAWSYEVIPLKK